ncbi:hypothetical protein M2103_001487 [Ereboglobus sp. PH5-5]|uniref:hypothetical protein n=1 Tax=Ereboglobus sp. PH5-5 TaxID=2940529 RepID=UPI002405879C|nr:hypothetical protein [Ereboglobus sp. PH5-5]MDF9833264.1 hypothetical protein [Ereboglobus sp. PH5-5]
MKKNITLIALVAAFSCLSFVARGDSVGVTAQTESSATEGNRGEIRAPALTPMTFDSFINPNWEGWKDRAIAYGMKSGKVPLPFMFNATISTDSTLVVRGENTFKKRWGLHVFEGYAKDCRSRITMILNKHIEEGLPVAEMYYYAAGYGQGLKAYNWFRIGSDVPYHSFLFGRDRAIFYGNVEMQNLFSLASIGTGDLRDTFPTKAERAAIAEEFNKTHSRADYENDADYRHARSGEAYKEELKWVKKEAIKKAPDGSIFYDTDIGAVVVKVRGKWMKMPLESLGDDYPHNAVTSGN